MNRKPGCICELDSETSQPVVEDYAECPVHKPDAVNPKDEAKGIVDRFKEIHQYSTMSDHGINITNQHCKKEGIIVVDKILSVLDTFQTHAYAKVLIPYYNEVKKEIQNL